MHMWKTYPSWFLELSCDEMLGVHDLASIGKIKIAYSAKDCCCDAHVKSAPVVRRKVEQKKRQLRAREHTGYHPHSTQS